MKPEVTTRGVLEIAEHEGIVLGPYFDSVRVLTYGVGHTKAAGGLDPAKLPKVDTRKWTDGQVRAELVRALTLFDDDLDKYEERVRSAVKRRILPHQFDALVSFDFNTGGIFKAKLTAAINAGNLSGDGFMGWIRPKELIKRRKAERDLFRTGNYDGNGDDIPIYDALPDGRTRYRMAMNGTELLALMPKRGATAALAAPAPVIPPRKPLEAISRPAPAPVGPDAADLKAAFRRDTIFEILKSLVLGRKGGVK
jgi:lysozyme